MSELGFIVEWNCGVSFEESWRGRTAQIHVPCPKLSDTVTAEAGPCVTRSQRTVCRIWVCKSQQTTHLHQRFLLALRAVAAQLENGHDGKGEESTSSPGACVKQTHLMKK